MKCTYFIILLIFSFNSEELAADYDPLKNTELLVYDLYMENVLQMFVYSLEDVGLCTIRMRDFTLDINEILYGFEVRGTLNYKNGFVIGMEDISIKRDTTNQELSNKTLTVSIYAKLEMKHISIVYDVIANLINSTHKATGIYVIEGTVWKVAVIKNLQTEKIDVDFKWDTTNNNQRTRMKFLPNNDYTVVFSRLFNTTINEVGDGIRDWNKTFAPILENIVKEKNSFPKLVYDSNLKDYQ